MPAARRADTFADYMATILEFLREQTLLAQACYEDSANRTRSTAPKFEVNQLVWLNAKNIKTLRPRKKLDWKNLGPFPIAEVLGLYTYRLNLPSSLTIHDVFNVNQLYLADDNPLPSQV
jgi:hypothetical protein